MTETRTLLEAILFVAENPILAKELAEVLEVSVETVEGNLRGLQTSLHDDGRGVVLREVAGGWRLYSHPSARAHLERFAATERATKLSPAALETLAVVAYRQPVSRGQVAEIRGVDPEHALRTLERRGLVVGVGNAPGPGQAILYGTTGLFLEKLGINDVSDLPPLADHVPPASVMDMLERPFRAEEPSTGFTS